jgi:uncharacterized protein
VNRVLFTVLLWVVLLLAGCRKEESRPTPLASSARALPSAAPAPSAAVSLAPPLPGPAWTRPFLYKVATKAKPFHVFGTIHLPDSRLDVFPPALEAAFEESQAVWTEIPLDDETQASVAPTLMLPEGKTLPTIVPAPLYERVAGAFKSEGIPSAAIDGLKPWAVSMQLSLLDRMITMALKKPLDVVLYRRAQQSSKEAGGIETAKEQLALFDTLKQSEQVELLRQTVELRDRMKKEKRDLLEELLVAYLNGSDDQLLTLIHEGHDEKDPLSAKLMKRMFTDRNKSMTERMVAKVGPAPDKTYFFAVGSGHLVGDDGIVQRLRQRGYEVTRVVP